MKYDVILQQWSHVALKEYHNARLDYGTNLTSRCTWFLFVYRSSFDEVLSWREADAVLVTPMRHTGTPAICPLSGTPYSLQNPGDGAKRQKGNANVGAKGEESPDTEDCEDSMSSGDVLTDEEPSTSPRRAVSLKSRRHASSGKENGESEETPSFVYQRRKFLLRTEMDEGETFGLVELPVGWPLER